MNENENLELMNSENDVQTSEESGVQETAEKTYTEAEFNAKLDEVLAKKIARNNAKVRKEYEDKYNPLINVLKAGTGKEDVGEMTETFRNFYTGKGIEIPTEPTYSDKDLEYLAKRDADEIISAGLDEVVEEVDRLAGLGVERMSAREKAMFKNLAEYRSNAEKVKELAKIGVKGDVLDSEEFKTFSSKFSPNTPITEIYEIFNKTQPKKEYQTIGSMTNRTSTNKGTVKEFYTREEAMRFTVEDLNKNPELYKAIERSMTKW